MQINDIADIHDLEEYDWVNEEGILENFKIRYTLTAMQSKKNPTNAKKAPLLKKNKEISGLIFREKKAKNIVYKLRFGRNPPPPKNIKIINICKYIYFMIILKCYFIIYRNRENA